MESKLLVVGRVVHCLREGRRHSQKHPCQMGLELPELQLGIQCDWWGSQWLVSSRQSFTHVLTHFFRQQLHTRQVFHARSALGLGKQQGGGTALPLRSWHSSGGDRASGR